MLHKFTKTLLIGICLVIFGGIFYASGQTLPQDPPPTTETSITTEPDTTPPVILSVADVSIEPTQAIIAWTTDEPSKGKVEYGRTTNYGTLSPETENALLESAVTLSGLLPETTYHYRVIVQDAAGNVTLSSDYILKTAAEPEPQDLDPPTISALTTSDITTSTASVSVSTGEFARVRIEYGPTLAYGASTPLDTEFSTTHAFTLTNLEPETTYHYRVIAEDESGNTAASFDETFTTDALPMLQAPTEAVTTSTTTSTVVGVTEPLRISELGVSAIGTSTARIIWKTNKLAESEIGYGETSDYEKTPLRGTGPALSHDVLLTGLTPATNYYYKVASWTTDGERAAFENREFNTLATATAVTEAPRIANLAVQEIGTSSAKIIWNTNIPSDAKVEYGETTTYGGTSNRLAQLATTHSITLQGLAPQTPYHFRAISANESGNSAFSSDHTFTTLASSQAPTLENLKEIQTEEIAPAYAEEELQENSDIFHLGPRPPTKLSPPKLIGTEEADGQVVFLWHKTPATSTAWVRIVRRQWTSPQHPKDGDILYEGRRGTFTDTGLTNGHTYHYAIYAVGKFRGFSDPIRIRATPTASNDQITVQATPTATQKTPAFRFVHDLSRGAQSKDIEHLQVLLAQDKAVYPEGLITGYFGALTEQALMRFQRQHTLSPTGMLDQKTRAKLEAVSKEIRIEERSSPGKTFTRDLTKGLRGEDVTALQKLLIRENVYPEALITGYFGPLTERGVAEFQRKYSIEPAAGYFGPFTRNAAATSLYGE